MTRASTPKLRRFVRGARIIFHLLCGLCWISIAFPFFSVKRRRWVRYRWSRELLALFAFQLKITGACRTRRA